MNVFKAAGVSVLLLSCSSAFAADPFEGFWDSGYGQSYEITKTADGYKIEYATSYGATDGAVCQGTGTVENGRMIPRMTKCIEYDEGTGKRVTKSVAVSDVFSVSHVFERRGDQLFIIFGKCSNVEDPGECEQPYDKYEKD